MNTFFIFLHGIDGTKRQISGLSPESTIDELKIKILEFSGIEPENQRLFFTKNELIFDKKKLKELNIEQDSTLVLVTRLRGGR